MKKVLFFWFISTTCFSQENTIRPELMIGKSVPSYELFTGKNPQIVAGVSYEYKNNDNSIAWQSILNNPTTGISLYYTNYGTKIKGNSVSLLPFLEFHPINNYKWSTRFGIGVSYFDTKYHSINNPKNNAISSSLTWAIQGFLYYDTKFKNDFDLRLGLGVFHHSNGHTKLPNEGLNSALLSLSTTFNLQKKSLKKNLPIFDKSSIKKYNNSFYGFRFGNGYHAFITEDSPLKPVYSITAHGGTFYKNITKISLGVNYRFYQHYYDYIKENNTSSYIENPVWNASNIYLSLGLEVMLGQIGVDWEGGLNIYKPFYKTHFGLQPNKSKYKLKKLFLGRLGLKLYAINTKKNPKNNFYIAAHINSNLSQADFTELSFGLVHNIFKKN